MTGREVLPPLLPAPYTLPTGRTLVMGILNVTPDSFSDGGRWLDPSRALDHALAMLEAGADLIDVGGESTRPGARGLGADEEWDRISGVVEALTGRGVVVSVDTYHAATARRAADAGVAIINDISGGRLDPDMARTVAASECAWIVQHFRALPGTPGEHFDYGDDLVGTLSRRILDQVRDAQDAGVPSGRIVIDPGLGFSLTSEQCWTVVENVSSFVALGYPVLIGASRKRFLAEAGEDRDATTARITERMARAGAWAVRVHDVAPNARAVRVAPDSRNGW